MLNVNISEELKSRWGKTIDFFYSLHLGRFSEEIQSVNLRIEEVPFQKRPAMLYRCELQLIPVAGHVIRNQVDRENCSAAIDYSFAKAKRMMQRRSRGLGTALLFKQPG